MAAILQERVKRARDLFAGLSVENPDYLPIFEAFERDLMELQTRKTLAPLDRARQRVQRLRQTAELV